jgi:hypothetical protein
MAPAAHEDLDPGATQPPAWRRGLTRMRHARRLTVVGIAALMLALPVAVSATHIFSDVPTSSFFHNPVSRLFGARLTGGCGGGKFCPNAGVTRGEIAAFLNRGLGRAAHDFGATDGGDWANILESGDGFVSIADLSIGGATGGTAHVLATGSMSAFTDENGVCPCDLRMALISEVGEMSAVTSTIIGAEASPNDNTRHGSVSMSHLFTVPTGTTVGFAILAVIFPTLSPSPENAAEIEWDLQATYVPFDASGGNPPAPIITTGEPDLPFGSWPFPRD